MAEKSAYALVIPPEFERILKSLKNRKPNLLKQLDALVARVLKEPMLRKPLRNVLRNYRRVNIDSYVLLYESINAKCA